jgi:hypothetical protein
MGLLSRTTGSYETGLPDLSRPLSKPNTNLGLTPLGSDRATRRWAQLERLKAFGDLRRGVAPTKWFQVTLESFSLESRRRVCLGEPSGLVFKNDILTITRGFFG